ncbi:hypothetical protein [Streptomyces sp. NPDC006527]|uniref:hypothetical protein n=1 Tax=Streptomyces sp. NPDC006527 TaxID=3364749 RepID=UPI00369B48DD
MRTVPDGEGDPGLAVVGVVVGRVVGTEHGRNDEQAAPREVDVVVAVGGRCYMQHGRFPGDVARVEFAQQAFDTVVGQLPQAQGPVGAGELLDTRPVRRNEQLVRRVHRLGQVSDE